ncbi:MAG TPA: class C beta-lactamase-related serine hydrolase [Candidatus Hydrogenedentes bacterium]|nr:class C beta-lactamase-related serine hydrolase [Candidatus Hydrogenedentota bacterium]
MNRFRTGSHKSISKAIILFALPLVTVMSPPTHAGPDAADFMNGVPPAPETRVDKTNWFVGPHNRWGLQHVREITSTIEISRGDGSVYQLPSTPKPISDIPVNNLDGEAGTIGYWLEASYTDGFLVLHEGNILAEVYMNSMSDDSYHNFFSMSKSFTGNLAGIIADRGQLDTNAKISKYVPEMKDGAYSNATVRHLLDMTVGIKYTEIYDDPDSDIYVYARASNASPNPDGLTLYDVLPKYPKEGEHGAQFHYVTANTDALGWVVQRASKRHLAELLSTEIWAKLGAERDAYVISDLNRTPWMGGGLNTTLRDAARFGLMMEQGGKINGKQVVPADFIKDIQKNAIDIGAPGQGYRNQWWVHPEFNAFSARGVAGQNIIIVPEHDLVIVKLSSWPALSGYHPDGRAYDQRATMAIIDFIKKL